MSSLHSLNAYLFSLPNVYSLKIMFCFCFCFLFYKNKIEYYKIDMSINDTFYTWHVWKKMISNNITILKQISNIFYFLVVVAVVAFWNDLNSWFISKYVFFFFVEKEVKFFNKKRNNFVLSHIRLHIYSINFIMCSI